MTENPRTIQKRELIQIYKINGFSTEEATAEIDFAIEVISGLTRKDLLIGIMPSPPDVIKLKKTVEKRVKTREPIAQILGYAFFMGSKFEVTKNTLIPRPETELLVRKAIEIIKKNNFKQVLDIGTGTGCIACKIAKLTTAQVLGVDISNGALKVALNNAMRLDLMNKALFRKSDLFSNVTEKYDVIVSNPPYIPPQDRARLQVEVRDFEPPSALFTTDVEGIEFYKKISEQAHEYLNNGGYLMFELGDGQAGMVCEMLKSHGFKNIKILKDVSGIERVITAIFSI